MNNANLLRQARKAIIHKIALSPSTITIISYPLISDGFGGTMPNPMGTAISSSKTVRISHQRNQVPENELKNTGLSTSLSRFILSDYKTPLTEGTDVSSYLGKKYKIGAVDSLEKYGGIIGYQAELIEGSNV
jgi:hypothetical protein